MGAGLAEKIAALPMSWQLVPIVQTIEGTSPADIRDIAKRWRKAAGKASDQSGRLNRAVGDVDNAWKGQSADAFVGYMGKYRKAGMALHDAVDSAAGALDQAAQALETAKTKVTTLCNELLTFKAGQADPDSDAAQQALVKKVLEAVPKATELENTASKALSTAMTEISRQLKERTPTFRSIDSPGDEPWRPSNGNTIDWKPVPIPKTTPTSFQGGNGNGVTPAAYTPGGSGGGPGATGTGGAGGVPQPLTFAPGTGTGARIIEAARQHIGKPYVWGANGPNAFDCSGLVYYALNQAGIKIGDTTAAGYQASGKPVSSPQPGDIVFFGHPASHVGVYIGDGQMIHAPRPGADVTVAPVSANGRSISYRRFT
ncbi:WXG100 family type VII secretion target [Nonomuraea fuscirosea]|uniref:bifunctional WXG100 family type VII secretion target/C40 family peptidase n=1 Tax=Nonomuraea fuscirosea TaxID=1291556 RepID=UPI00342288F7